MQDIKGLVGVCTGAGEGIGRRRQIAEVGRGLRGLSAEVDCAALGVDERIAEGKAEATRRDTVEATIKRQILMGGRVGRRK